MKTPLYNHQVVGASWMLRREFSEEGPRGGILGDEMGMGKTLEALACIVSNRPTDDDINTCSKTTLIVTPANAIKQWEEEIRKHTNDECIRGVVHWKECKGFLPEAFKSLTIVSISLASYHEVSRQFPSKKLLNDCGSEEERKRIYDENLGELFKVTFWRIILDEAHNIKNKDTQTSIACRNLLGRHRWGMSGTPITNSLDEIYPYLKFLKTDWVGNLRDFQYLYGNPGDASNYYLTMADTFMDRPLYDIPTCEITVRRVSLTQEERVIYSVVESHFRKIINAILKRRRKANRAARPKDLTIHLRFLIRLRQGVAHPFLLEPVLKKTLNQGDLHEIQRRLREINIALASQEEDVCRICYEEPHRARKAKCEHVFCKRCLNNHIFDEFQRRVIPKCPECDTSLADLNEYKQPDTKHSDNKDDPRELKSQRYKVLAPKQGRDIFEQHPRLTNSQSRFLQQCDKDYPKPVVPSAKTIAVTQAILKWQSEAPDDKIIVFMDFKMTGAILGRVLNAEGIKFLYLFGDMSQVAKQNAVRAFHDKKHVKIASFRCGSVALNLTCANRVILVDLWWNTAIEMQAFARVFRIGQAKKTHFLRIIAQNTIDNRIEALQEKKLREINKVMGPDERKELSTEEIAALFGHLKKFEDGSFEVLSDDDEDAEFNEIEEVEVRGDT
ncbi:SNF2 family N-terminal domain-containing protein [Xylaria digitata]|nr:SNF2 family N-terminal domain-containing protein [Xylaria digitata]